MKNHKYADLFPMIEGEALDALIADIKEHGQRESIVLFDDKILDGRNRWRACKAAIGGGLRLSFSPWEPTDA